MASALPIAHKPCVHGQKVAGIPSHILGATVHPRELAPKASDGGGSGGVYRIPKPAFAPAILASKSAFLNEAEGAPVILGTSNHSWLMPWHSAGAGGLACIPPS